MALTDFGSELFMLSLRAVSAVGGNSGCADTYINKASYSHQMHAVESVWSVQGCARARELKRQSKATADLPLQPSAAMRTDQILHVFVSPPALLCVRTNVCGCVFSIGRAVQQCNLFVATAI